MAFAVTRLPGEPIIILQLDVGLEERLSSIESVRNQVIQIAADVPSLLYVLMDMRAQDVKFSDFLLMIQNMPQHPDGTPLDPRIRAAMIGDHPMIEIGVRKLNQSLGLNIATFPTLDAALAWARAEIRRQSDQTPG
jgi:hypothetical protein